MRLCHLGGVAHAGDAVVVHDADLGIGHAGDLGRRDAAGATGTRRYQKTQGNDGDHCFHLYTLLNEPPVFTGFAAPSRLGRLWNDRVTTCQLCVGSKDK
jgi:hypothetical protein